LWATLGEQARPLEQQRRWIRALRGEVQAATTIQEGKDELQRLLRERAMLLVLDDVWQANDADALRVGGPRCRILLTTRKGQTVAAAQWVQVNVMERAESQALLQQASGGTAPEVAERIATRVGDLPLALSLVAGLLREGVGWETIERSLAQNDLRFGGREQTVFSAMASSVEALPNDDRARYEELVIFPPDTKIDHDAARRLWGRARRAWLGAAPAPRCDGDGVPAGVAARAQSLATRRRPP
jgi:hypothetical protein